MKLFKKNASKVHLTRSEALDCVPLKNALVTESRTEMGLALLSYPLQVRPWLAALMRRFGRSYEGPPPKKLQLDSLGTSVWDLMDGRRSVRQVIQQFSHAFKLHPKEAELSVTSFMRELGKRGLIAFK